MSKRFILIIVLLIAAVGGLIIFTSDNAGAPTGSGNGNTSNHLFGDGQKGVTLVEYGDYECPACGAYYPLVKQITEKYKTDITFQFRNFPLTQLHPNAYAGHRAAEAADKQGKYWEMHDLLYEGQQTWGSSYGANQNSAISTFEGYAAQLGLDVAKFKTDYASTEVNDTINADIKAGQALKITGTPTFFIDGKKIEESPRTVEDFSKLIDDAIAAKNPAPAQ
jgi:protein-disulfide isomerase